MANPKDKPAEQPKEPEAPPVVESAPVDEAPSRVTPGGATPAIPPSKRLSAEQEAGRSALQRKHSPQAKEDELNKGKKK